MGEYNFFRLLGGKTKETRPRLEATKAMELFLVRNGRQSVRRHKKRGRGRAGTGGAGSVKVPICTASGAPSC